MRSVFADPKVRVVFKRIFGNEAHKDLLIALLNDLLDLDGEHRIVDLQYLSTEQVPPHDSLKNSIVDVKCTDARGTRYIVEMQVLNVEGFEKRMVYNLCKAYTAQLQTGEEYPTLNDVVAVAICDFVLWPDRSGETPVPMLSRWRMAEEGTGALRFQQLRFAMLELPKYRAGDEPTTTVEKWAYFFREAERLREVPQVLAKGPYAQALEVARTWHFTPQEWEAYDQAKMAEQDARGALSLAEKQGLEQGLERGRREGIVASIRMLCTLHGIELTPERKRTLAEWTEAQLVACFQHLAEKRSWS